MIAILTASLERYATDEWREKHLGHWRGSTEVIAEAITGISEDHPLLVSEKAETLAYSHQNILTSQRIITEVRPVFDTAGESIKEALILHTLLIEYYDGISGPKRISFTLDSADVAALRKGCQRAEGKTKSLKQGLKSLNPIELPEDIENSS